MSLSLHHSKKSSQLPLLIKNTNKINHNKNYSLISSIQSSKNFEQQSQSLHQCDRKNSTNIKQNIIMANHSQIMNKLKGLNDLKPCLHIPQKYLIKNKKYYRVDAQMRVKQNIIKNDIQKIIDQIVGEKQKNDLIVLKLRKNYNNNKKDYQKRNFNYNENQCIQKVYKKRITCPISSVNQFNKQKQNINIGIQMPIHQMVKNQSNFFSKNKILTLQIRNFKGQLKILLQKYQKLLQNSISQTNDQNYSRIFQLRDNKYQPKSTLHYNTKQMNKKQNFFKQFTRLSQQSYDFVEYYLKSNYITEFIHEPKFDLITDNKEQIQKMLKNIGQTVILSVLKSNFKCLQKQYNSPDIINRIILALGLNPLNQFQFIRQETFTKFKKILNGSFSKKQAKDFILKYLFLQSQLIKKQEFQNLIYSILKKYRKIVNSQTIESLFVRFKFILEQMMKQYEIQKTISSKNSNKKSEAAKLNFQNINSSQKDNKAQNIATKDNKTYTKDQIKWILTNDLLWIWDQVIRSMFMV